MASGEPKDITIRRALEMHDAIELIEVEDLRDNGGENKERQLNIVTRLDAKIVYRLARFKDQLNSIVRASKVTQRKLHKENITETDAKGVATKLNAGAYNEAWDRYLDETKEKVNIPKFVLTDFIKDSRFFVPMKFLTLMGDAIENDNK